MTEILLQIGATKLALAIALAGVVWVVQQRVKRPATAHALWLMVLGAMLVPAVVPVRVLPEEVEEEVVAQSGVVAQSESRRFEFRRRRWRWRLWRHPRSARRWSPTPG